jgi:hypothetical protein
MEATCFSETLVPITLSDVISQKIISGTVRVGEERERGWDCWEVQHSTNDPFYNQQETMKFCWWTYKNHASLTWIPLLCLPKLESLFFFHLFLVAISVINRKLKVPRSIEQKNFTMLCMEHLEPYPITINIVHREKIWILLSIKYSSQDTATLTINFWNDKPSDCHLSYSSTGAYLEHVHSSSKKATRAFVEPDFTWEQNK